MDIKDVAIVLLAAGNARRFGADKLMADLDGMPLGVRAAAQMGQLGAAAHIAVCQPDAAITPHYLKLGYTIAENRHAESGLSGSLHLAVEAAAQTEAQALLILLADMPFVELAHVVALIASSDGEIIASSDGTQSMPPAIFPRAAWSRLLEAEGDAGARHILLNASTRTAPEGSLRDIDTPDDLAASKAPPLGLDRSS
jgi:molybdenum cofactor cytidylyltransferase